VVPDGLVVDSEGCLWVAMWSGGEVRRYSPTGGLLATLPVPVSQPTCPAFGGPDLSDLYLTTAWQGLSEQQRAAEPLAGHLLRTRPGAAGLPAGVFAG
jgi:sugar lactone lactonase YvrE